MEVAKGLEDVNLEKAPAHHKRAVTVLPSSSAPKIGVAVQLVACLLCVSTLKSSSQVFVCSDVLLGWLVSGVSGKPQSSIVLLAIENVWPLVMDDEQRWVSFEDG